VEACASRASSCAKSTVEEDVRFALPQELARMAEEWHDAPGPTAMRQTAGRRAPPAPRARKRPGGAGALLEFALRSAPERPPLRLTFR
jgi:hypothetical protein